jgi:7,8-dihydropterin-6-yl-methyl-4-(beta-D-ribofuranosyl)aminobenzene 5'-phosphate synthase
MRFYTLPVFLIVTFIILILFSCKWPEKEAAGKEAQKMEENLTGNLTISVVYDNQEYDPKFRLGFGFSGIVKYKDRYLLFDTGGDSPTLLENMETLGIKPSQISSVVLSHIHGDHTGGLLGFLEKNSNVNVYVPASFPSSFKDEIKSTGASLTEVDEPAKISNNIYSTGELGTFIKEQSLIIDSDKGLIVITGCAHPGIVEIIKKAKEQHNKSVYLAIVKEFRKLGVEKVAPSHCTGEPAIHAFTEEYGDNFIKSGVGRIIKI